MSEEMKKSTIYATIITAIIVILVIIFGNTGSGFFRSLMVFIVGTILGTPIAMLFGFIGSIFNPMAKYGGFIFGSLIGVGLGAWFFSDPTERGFMYVCMKNTSLSKSQCECTYDKLEDHYGDLEKILINPTKDYMELSNKFMNECTE